MVLFSCFLYFLHPRKDLPTFPSLCSAEADVGGETFSALEAVLSSGAMSQMDLLDALEAEEHRGCLEGASSTMRSSPLPEKHEKTIIETDIETVSDRS